MKKIMLMMVLLLVSTVGYGQMADITETIKAKEKQMYEAIKTGDMKTFKDNLDERFVGVSENGIADRAKEIETVSKLTIETYKLSNFKVMQPSDGVAIVVYTAAVKGTHMGEAFDGEYHASSGWMLKDDGNWRAIIHTEVEGVPMEETMGLRERQ